MTGSQPRFVARVVSKRTLYSSSKRHTLKRLVAYFLVP